MRLLHPVGRRARLGWLGPGVLAICCLLLTAPARAADPEHAPERAPRSLLVPPTRAYLADRLLVTPHDGTLVVPITHRRTRYLSVLGHGPAGYIVERVVGGGEVSPSTRYSLFAIRRAGRQTVAQRISTIRVGQGSEIQSAHYTLSRDGSRIALASHGADGGSIQVMTTYGAVLASLRSEDASLVDFTGPSMVFDDDGGVEEWTIGNPPVTLTSGLAVDADIAHRLLFMNDDDELFGIDVVTFDDPGTVLWTSIRGGWRVSPDGTYVASGGGGVVTVYDAADGTTVSRTTEWDTYRFVWDSNDTFLMVSGDRIVRCQAATGVCTPATRRLSGRVTLAAPEA